MVMSLDDDISQDIESLDDSEIGLVNQVFQILQNNMGSVSLCSSVIVF